MGRLEIGADDFIGGVQAGPEQEHREQKPNHQVCLQIQRHVEKWGMYAIVTPIREAVLADSPQKLLRRSSSLRASVSTQVEEVVTQIKTGQALLAEQESEVHA